MGTLASPVNWSGREVAGIVLGDPALDDAGRYVWDHPLIPDGTLDENGQIIAGELGDLVEPKLAPVDAPVTKRERAAGVDMIRDGVLMSAGKPVRTEVRERVRNAVRSEP